jgi:hypothetical protein
MIFIQQALAQNLSITPVAPCVIPALCGKSQGDTPALFAKLFSAIIGFMLTIAAIWAFIQLIQSGILWISSGGDKTALEAARNRILNSIVGLFIVFASWALFLIILRFLGMSPLEPGSSFNISFPTLF